MAEKNTKRGLGTGLGAIFSGAEAVEQQKSGDTVPISKVEPRRGQPRTAFDETAMQELAESIGRHGVLQPITVRRLDSGYYQIIAGERRWRAARMAGLKEVPVRIIEADDRKASELALVENLQREDLNPVEEARGLKTLTESYGLTQEEAAESVGKSRSALTNSLRLLNLAPPVLEMLERGLLSSGHARALLAIENAAIQQEAAETVAAKGLSVRQTEALAVNLAKAPPPETAKAEPPVDYVALVRDELEAALGRHVRITDGRKKGRIELEYYGADDREALFQALKNIGKR